MAILNATVVDFVLFWKYSSRVVSAGDAFTDILEWKNIPGNISSHGSFSCPQADTGDVSQKYSSRLPANMLHYQRSLYINLCSLQGEQGEKGEEGFPGKAGPKVRSSIS